MHVVPAPLVVQFGEPGVTPIVTGKPETSTLLCRTSMRTEFVELDTYCARRAPAVVVAAGTVIEKLAEPRVAVLVVALVVDGNAGSV